MAEQKLNKGQIKNLKHAKALYNTCFSLGENKDGTLDATVYGSEKQLAVLFFEFFDQAPEMIQTMKKIIKCVEERRKDVN